MNMPFYVSPEQVMKDRADYARKGIARGRSLVALECSSGVLIVADNGSRTLSKISEIYDRVAFAAVGKYNEFQMLRVAGVRHADLKGYSYSREDVTAKELANAYAQTLGQVFTHEMKPYEVELLVVEVGRAGDDHAEMYHLFYDGVVMDEQRYAVLGGQAEQISETLASEYEEAMQRVKRVNIPEWHWTHLATAVVCGSARSTGDDAGDRARGDLGETGVAHRHRLPGLDRAAQLRPDGRPRVAHREGGHRAQPVRRRVQHRRVPHLGRRLADRHLQRRVDVDHRHAGGGRPGVVRLEVGAADLQPGDDLRYLVDRPGDERAGLRVADGHRDPGELLHGGPVRAAGPSRDLADPARHPGGQRIPPLVRGPWVEADGERGARGRLQHLGAAGGRALQP